MQSGLLEGKFSGAGVLVVVAVANAKWASCGEVQCARSVGCCSSAVADAQRASCGEPQWGSECWLLWQWRMQNGRLVGMFSGAGSVGCSGSNRCKMGKLWGSSVGQRVLVVVAVTDAKRASCGEVQWGRECWCLWQWRMRSRRLMGNVSGRGVSIVKGRC